MGLKFHIHVDATRLAPAGMQVLCAGLGFAQTDFCGHPAGLAHYEPRHHLTWKGDDPRRFKEQFEQAKRVLGSPEHQFAGYLEGEHITCDIDIEARPFNPCASLPVGLSLGPLPAGTFRESELHITACKDRSDPRLLEALAASGLFGAWLPKPYGTAVVYTAQGSARTVKRLLDGYRHFLLEAGGAVACSLKEERIARWWTSDPGVALPPVVRSWGERVGEGATRGMGPRLRS